MKRALPAVLAFLGVACITAAVAIPLWLVPQLKVVPLDLDITSNATTIASDGAPGDRFPAVIFDRCSIGGPKAVTLQAHLTQQRRSIIVDPSDRRQATVQSAQIVQIDRTRNAAGDESTPPPPAATGELECNDGLLTANIDHVSVNRKTSVPNGTVSSLQLEAAPEGVNPNDVSVQLPNRKGFQYKFPFGTKQRSYLYYDLNTRQDTEASFVGVETIDGVETYHFETTVPETDLSTLPNPQNEAALGTMLTMPARWWGITGRGVRPGDQINMHRYATAKRHFWVEPETGTIVDGREDQYQYFRSPYQDDEATPSAVREFRLDALKATFKWTDATVSEQAAKASGYQDQLKLGNLWLPLVLGIAGAALLIPAVLLVLRRRSRRADSGPDTPADENAADTGIDSEGDTEYLGTVSTDSEPPGTFRGSDEPTVIDSPKPPSPNLSKGFADDDGDAYLWDSPTQRIPRVEGPAPAIDGDFRPVDKRDPNGI